MFWVRIYQSARVGNSPARAFGMVVVQRSRPRRRLRWRAFSSARWRACSSNAWRQAVVARTLRRILSQTFILVPQRLDLAGQCGPAFGGTGRRGPCAASAGHSRHAPCRERRSAPPVSGGGPPPRRWCGNPGQSRGASPPRVRSTLRPDRFDLRPVDGRPGIRLGLHLVPEVEILPAQVGLAEEFVQQPLVPHLGPGTAGGTPGTVIPAEQAVIVRAELVVVGVQYPGQRWPVELRAQAMHPHRTGPSPLTAERFYVINTKLYSSDCCRKERVSI